MKVDVKMARSFNKAVSNPENIQSNGHVNWNYVDADVYMDVGPRGEDGNLQTIKNIMRCLMF